MQVKRSLAEVAEALAQKCRDHGMPAPDRSEVWETALEKILALIELLEKNVVG